MTVIMNIINLVAFVIAIAMVLGGVAMLVKWLIDQMSDF
jgi:hypothetical protein